MARARSKEAALRRSSRNTSMAGCHQPRANSAGPASSRTGLARTSAPCVGLRRVVQIKVRAGRERLLYADEVYRRGNNANRSGNEAVRGRVEEMPVIALLAALGVGYLLGMLIHGRD
ncbi:hypothetical protein [Methylobacterium sp. R2-1]|uniref:hypothetical protein n=1 Tax=Methylobacterium sp. R2-1 TaxID=2587064 RepID=UPI00162016D4|nr:hypothetical protein [Methylobacterium sp. R2-1]MBB2964537.1 hypothetical protein [Methylobacterium sp. R2-1]